MYILFIRLLLFNFDNLAFYIFILTLYFYKHFIDNRNYRNQSTMILVDLFFFKLNEYILIKTKKSMELLDKTCLLSIPAKHDEPFELHP